MNTKKIIIFFLILLFHSNVKSQTDQELSLMWPHTRNMQRSYEYMLEYLNEMLRIVSTDMSYDQNSNDEVEYWSIWIHNCDTNIADITFHLLAGKKGFYHPTCMVYKKVLEPELKVTSYPLHEDGVDDYDLRRFCWILREALSRNQLFLHKHPTNNLFYYYAEIDCPLIEENRYITVENNMIKSNGNILTIDTEKQSCKFKKK